MKEVYEFTPAPALALHFAAAAIFQGKTSQAPTLEEALSNVIGPGAFDRAIEKPGITKVDPIKDQPGKLLLRDDNKTQLGTFARIQ